MSKKQTREYWAAYRMKDPARAMFTRLKSRARERGLPFTITVADCAIPATCPVLGLPLAAQYGQGSRTKCSPSLDRIDNSKGYEPGNVQVISDLANRMKCDATQQELLAFADWVICTYRAKPVDKPVDKLVTENFTNR